MIGVLASGCGDYLAGCHPHRHSVHVPLGNGHSAGFGLGGILLIVLVLFIMDKAGMFPDGM